MTRFYFLTNRFSLLHFTVQLRIIVFLFSPCILLSQGVNIDSLEQLLETNIDNETEVNILIQLSEIYTYTDPDKEEEYLRQGLKVANGHEALEIKVYAKLAFNLLRKNQIDSTMLIGQKLLTYYQRTLDTEGVVFCYTIMGHAMGLQSELERSINYYYKGLELSEERSLNKAALYLSICGVQKSLGKQKEAMKSCFKALKIAEELNDNRLLGGIRDNLGSLYYTQSDYPNAIKYYKKAIEASEKAGITISVASSKINLANTYLVINNERKALEIYEEVLEFSEEINYSPLMLQAKSYLAYFYAQANSDKCEPLLADLDTLTSDLDNTTLIQYYKAKIYFYQYQEKYPEAIEFANKFQKHVVKDTEDEKNAFELLAGLQHKIGDYKKAYNYYVKFKMLSDSVANQQQLADLKIREAQYDFDKEQLKLEQTHKIETVAQKRFNILISVSAVILCIISFFLFRISQSRRKLSNDLLEKNKDLASLNESKTRFFANVSHELKTPLTLIMNPLQKLKKQKTLTEEDLYLVSTAEKNSQGLFDLTNQILELTKFEVDKVSIQYVNLNFPYLLKKIFANFESLAKNRGIEFQLDYQGNDNLTIQTDEYKLQTILKNLISNALKFTPPKNIVKVIIIEKESTLEIQVHDSGRGILSDDLPYVFDRYFQSKAPKVMREGGTGIGLAICKEYSKLLGGSIWVESTYGESTSFHVSLPKVVAESAIVFADELIPSEIDKFKIDQPVSIASTNSLPTLLLVEDNLEMQKYIQYILHTSYSILIAGNGQEGINILEKYSNQIQLIVSDVMMPVMDGYKFLEVVKKEEKFASIPIIMLTALGDTQHKLKGLRIGVDDYITKPFVNEELMARIDNLLISAEERKAFRIIETSTSIEEGILKQQVVTPVVKESSIQNLEWLKKLEVTVKENIADSRYTVDKLSMQMVMSRSLLYRKIKALTGLTPNNYINQVRYERARHYLENRQFSSIKMIAYQVGFKDEKYFARKFKKRFGKYPSEYL